MQATRTTKPPFQGVIAEAREMYETEPVAAALMLHHGILEIEDPIASFTGQAAGQEAPPSRGESLLRTAFWTLKVMGEDARAGIAPTATEWEMNISVAESIVRMMEEANDPA